MSPEPMESCECGGEGFARFSVLVETAGPRPDWLPTNDRSTTVCVTCARKAAGISDFVTEVAEAAVEQALADDGGPKLAAVDMGERRRTFDASQRASMLAAETAADAGPKLAAVLADEPGRTIEPSHRALILAVERMPGDPSGGTVVRIARRAFDDPGAWGCVLADCVRDIAKTMARPGLLEHGESMTTEQRGTAARLLDLFRAELIQMERLDPGNPYGPPAGPE